MGWFGSQVRIALVIIAGIALFFFDLGEAAMLETGIDDLLSIAMAAFAVWVLWWRMPDSALRFKSIVVALLYVLVTVVELWATSGSSLDEFVGFLVSFIIVPVVLLWSLVRRMVFGRTATT